MKLNDQDKVVQDEVAELLGGVFEEFKPIACYDENLDCIRVLVRDCSITETRINEAITMLEDSHPEKGERIHVGFTIKGARHFCVRNGLPTHGPVTVSKLLNALLVEFPELVVDLAVKIAMPILEESDIDEIVFPEAA